MEPSVERHACRGPRESEDKARELSDLIAACTDCKLHRTRTQAVFGSGSLTAPLIVVGEAPGANEDARGIPFVGRSGMLLRQYLKEMGLGPDRAFITNTVRCRPPGNRDPFPSEVYQCSGHLFNTIDLVQPVAILAVGAVASRALTGEATSMAEYREKSGEWEWWTGCPVMIPIFCTYHPAYILRRPDMATHLRHDLQSVREFVDGKSPRPQAEEGAGENAEA